jgi:hypothetical protein
MKNDPPSEDDIESLLISIERTHSLNRAATAAVPVEIEDKHVPNCHKPTLPFNPSPSAGPVPDSSFKKEEIMQHPQIKENAKWNQADKSFSDCGISMKLPPEILSDSPSEKSGCDGIRDLIEILEARRKELLAIERRNYAHTPIQGQSDIFDLEHYRRQALKLRRFVEAESIYAIDLKHS